MSFSFINLSKLFFSRNFYPYSIFQYILYFLTQIWRIWPSNLNWCWSLSNMDKDPLSHWILSDQFLLFFFIYLNFCLSFLRLFTLHLVWLWLILSSYRHRTSFSQSLVEPSITCSWNSSIINCKLLLFSIFVKNDLSFWFVSLFYICSWLVENTFSFFFLSLFLHAG